MVDLQNSIINKVGIDKILHFLAGGWLACIAPNWFYALLIGLMIGLMKELIDRFIRKSTFDYLDWVATFAGSVVTAMYLMIV